MSPPVNGSSSGVARHGEYYFKGQSMANNPSPVFATLAGGWFLAVMLCNLLLNWGSFQAGFIAGWQAAP